MVYLDLVYLLRPYRKSINKTIALLAVSAVFSSASTYAAYAQNGAPSSGLNFSGGDADDKKDADNIKKTLEGQPTAVDNTDNSKPDNKPEKKSLAQYTPGTYKDVTHTHLPTVTGTVKIRQPFKLFAQEQLIHNLSFRDTPVKEVIGEIARRGNLNIIIDKSVVGKITGDLRDVTLNEAMDSVLAAAGLQSRTLDNNTVIIGTQQAMVQLGLNRPLARAFKLSYAHPYDVAMILWASIFNKGVQPSFHAEQKSRGANDQKTETAQAQEQKGGGPGAQGLVNQASKTNSTEADLNGDNTETTQSYDLDKTPRVLRGTTRSQTQEGVGFNNAATDPGSQQIRAFQELPADYMVDQNGGGAIVIPDTKNRQIIVVGTQEDIAVAEESVHLLDRRPLQVHIQASLVELDNAAVRQLGANLNVQGNGASASLLGNAQAPLVQYLPGLGSPGSTATMNTATMGFTPNVGFLGTNTTTNAVSSFSGLVGSLLSPVTTTIAGVTPSPTSQSGFNFLTLSPGAGGRSNIATLPTALNVSLNMLLQTNKAKVVANPSVVVVDNTETLITIANEVVHKVTSTVSLGVVNTNVELTKAGIFLNVLPKVTEDGFITMRLRPQVSSPLGPPQTFGTTVVTLLDIREIMSQEVRVKDGQTLVLGGLFTEAESAQLAKVPYLAETPVLGALFRNSLKGRNRTELMLLITPKVVEEDPTQLTDTAPASEM